jgi:hypothetical protein
MQKAISQETLLRILQQGEVLPIAIDIDEEIQRTEEETEEELALERLTTNGMDMAFQSPNGDNAGQGESLNSQTLPTPMRSGRNE